LSSLNLFIFLLYGIVIAIEQITKINNVQVTSMEKAQVAFKKMSLWQVVIIGVAYMTPMVVFDTFGIVSGITEGRVPLAYILALCAMLLTAFSYARFSRQTEKPRSEERRGGKEERYV